MLFRSDKSNRLVVTPIDSEWLKTLDEVQWNVNGVKAEAEC